MQGRSSLPNSVEHGLERRIGSAGALAIAVNGVVGSGLFVLPALAAKVGGVLSPWLFLILGFVMLPIGITLGRVSRLTSVTGGPAAYVRAGFGPGWGALAAWIGFATGLSGMAAVTDILATSLAEVFPRLASGWERVVFIFVIWASLGLINCFGIRQSSKSMSVLTFVKTLLLVGLVFALLLVFRARLTETVWLPGSAFASGFSPTISSVLPLLFAFVGFEGVLVPAGETQDPDRSIPRAIIICLLGCAIFYFLAQAACVTSVPDLANDLRPLSSAASQLSADFGHVFVTSLACISIFGTLAAGALTQPRYLFALGSQVHSLRVFAKLHRRFHTPYIAILVAVGMNAALACVSGFIHLARWVVLAKFVLYTVSTLSLLKLGGVRRIFGAPGLSLVICSIVAWQVKAFEWATFGFISICGGLLIFLAMRSRPPVPSDRAELENLRPK